MIAARRAVPKPQAPTLSGLEGEASMRRLAGASAGLVFCVGVVAVAASTIMALLHAGEYLLSGVTAVLAPGARAAGAVAALAPFFRD